MDTGIRGIVGRNDGSGAGRWTFHGDGCTCVHANEVRCVPKIDEDSNLTGSSRRRAARSETKLEEFEREIMPKVVDAYRTQAEVLGNPVYEGTFEVCEAYSQIVFGTNYEVLVAKDEKGCKDGETYLFQVYCPLDFTGEPCRMRGLVELPEFFF